MTVRISALILVLATGLGCGTPAPPPETDGTPPYADNCPTFTRASHGLPTEGEWRSHLSVADIDGDGLDDIAAIPRKGKGAQVFIGDGLGNWSEASDGLRYSGRISCGVGTRLVDLNRDDKLDLVVADHCRGVLIYLGDGGKSWKPFTRGLPQPPPGYNDADVGDIDGDGLLDIVAIAASPEGFLVLKGTPEGTFRIDTETGLPDGGSGWQLWLRDVNGDDRLDVVCSFNAVVAERRRKTPDRTMIWLQDENGKFQVAQGFPEKGRFKGVALLERPDRATPDLLFGVVGYYAGLYPFESENGTEWTQLPRIDQPWFGKRPYGFVGVSLADLNADGCEDILTTQNGIAWIAMGDCEGGWTFCPEETLEMTRQPGPWGIVAGEFNGDGRPDIAGAFGHESRGSIEVWLNEGD